MTGLKIRSQEDSSFIRCCLLKEFDLKVQRPEEVKTRQWYPRYYIDFAFHAMFDLIYTQNPV